jgi:hypothetical protein
VIYFKKLVHLIKLKRFGCAPKKSIFTSRTSW